MKGYKIPEGWAVRWRNAIERYPKDSKYALGMSAVVGAIEAYPLEELDENPWHTGTPTDEGWYLCKTKASDFSVHYYDGNKWDFCPLDFVIKWQKIEED